MRAKENATEPTDIGRRDKPQRPSRPGGQFDVPVDGHRQTYLNTKPQLCLPPPCCTAAGGLWAAHQHHIPSNCSYCLSSAQTPL
ncbi:hypothetical protein VZT92_006949 [Zoarces viviparus]|uniref:Uncharacterized protein n=1 Tax=Zoarces viviparus TaxID=48416 RepID=A0AAW1FID9_ZOAVI